MTTVYVVQQDLLDRDQSLVWTLATDPDTDELDEAKITDACNEACSEIDSFLSRRYQLPLTQVPSLLTRLAVSIAFYWLADRDNGVTDLVQKRYDDALKTLREIQSGKRNLGLPEEDKPSETSSGKVEVIAATRPSIRAGLGRIL